MCNIRCQSYSFSLLKICLKIRQHHHHHHCYLVHPLLGKYPVAVGCICLATDAQEACSLEHPDLGTVCTDMHGQSCRTHILQAMFLDPAVQHSRPLTLAALPYDLLTEVSAMEMTRNIGFVSGAVPSDKHCACLDSLQSISCSI